VVDVADIVRGEGAEYLRTHFVRSEQEKALYDIVRCRTEAMGSVTVTCDRCRAEYPLFRSCRNRSCPSCQSEARRKWLEARREEILPVEYLQVVFNTPPELRVLAQYHPEELYDAVIRAAGQAVVDVGRSVLNAQLGCQVHLQTWGQNMAYHLHAHCVVPCGGFSPDGSRWIAFKPGDLSKKALWRRFRTLTCKGLRAAIEQGQFDRLPKTVAVEELLARIEACEWRVYAESPFDGPEKLFEYLSRYVYRAAITNERIESYENRQVTFRWRDYRHGNEEKPCRLEGQEFVRRFVMHVPPRGFVRIRSYGFLANRNRKRNLERARQIIAEAGRRRTQEPFKPLRLCPACSGRDPRTVHFAPPPDVAQQVTLPLRPPPMEPIAA
jgi:hypothetical protein